MKSKQSKSRDNPGKYRTLSQATLGDDTQKLDLSGAHLSYGDFKDATFTGASAIKLNGAGLVSSLPRKMASRGSSAATSTPPSTSLGPTSPTPT
eukprot:scaffold2343_cov58-Phaeocystis_antarctica.AAC.1